MTIPWPTALTVTRRQATHGFGYGLELYGLRVFQCEALHIDVDRGDTLTVEADVKNIGKRAGEEVAELYLTPPRTDVSPKLALDGFTRVSLAPGETKHVTFTLDPRTLSQVDGKGVRAVTPGSYKIAVGSTQPTETTNTQTTTFTIEGKQEMPR